MLYRTPKEEFDPVPEPYRHLKEIEVAIVLVTMIMICVVSWSVM